MTYYRRTLVGMVGVGLGPLLAAALLTGCGGGKDAEGGGPGAAEERSASGGGLTADRPGDPVPSDGARTGGDDTAARVLPGERDIVYRGQVSVRVKDVSRASTRAEELVLAVDGVVFSQQTYRNPDRGGSGEATMTLRVPPTQFASTLDSLGRLGKEISRSRSAQDVTIELADTGSRVRSQERSVARVRALLGEAETIGEVVQIESELARREADLESLQAQLTRLEDVTAPATIDVTLLARGAPRPAPLGSDDDLGFVSGLRGGWAALVEILLVAMTVLGAALPFAIAALLVGFPTYALLRGRRLRRTGPVAAGTPVPE